LHVANRYDALIQQALADIKEDPYRTGVKKMQGFSEDMYSYHLQHSNKREEGHIKSPRHAVFYFIINEKVIAVASISREIRERHIAGLNRESILDEMSGKDGNGNKES